MGWTPAELYSRPYLDFMHREDRAKVAAFAERLEHMPPGESLQVEAARAARRRLPLAALQRGGRRRAGAAGLPVRAPTSPTCTRRSSSSPASGRARSPHRARALQRRAGALRLGRLARPAPVADRGLGLPRAAREPPRRRAAPRARARCSATRARAASACTRWSRTCSRTRAWVTPAAAPERVDAGELVAPDRADRRPGALSRSASCPVVLRAPARVRAAAGEPDRQRGEVRGARRASRGSSVTRGARGRRLALRGRRQRDRRRRRRTPSGSSACSSARRRRGVPGHRHRARDRARKSSRPPAGGSGCRPRDGGGSVFCFTWPGLT